MKSNGNNRLLAITLSAGFYLVLAGCTPGLPTCATGSLERPDLASPVDFATVDSLQPTMHWTYPDATCNPQGYRIEVFPADNPSDLSKSGGTGNPSTTWNTGHDLAPGKEYFWRVAAINGTTLGPYSSRWRFFTGPDCDPATLLPPTLTEPADGATVDTVLPLLHWLNGNVGCLPHGYAINLSIDPTFPDFTDSGGTAHPSQSWLPGHDLQDCTTYYWRVASGTGETYSTYSPTWHFTIQTGALCLMPLSPDITLAPLLPLDTVTPTITPTITPTTTPTPAPSAKFTFFPKVTPDHIYYRGGGCGSKEVQFYLTVSDPAAVRRVDLYYRLKDKKTKVITEWSNTSMDPTSDGGFLFKLFSENIPGFQKFGESWLQYQFVAVGLDEKVVARSEVFWNVEVSACGK